MLNVGVEVKDLEAVGQTELVVLKEGRLDRVGSMVTEGQKVERAVKVMVDVAFAVGVYMPV